MLSPDHHKRQTPLLNQHICLFRFLNLTVKYETWSQCVTSREVEWKVSFWNEIQTFKKMHLVWQNDWWDIIKHYDFFFKGHRVTCSCTGQLLILATPRWKWFNEMSEKCTQRTHVKKSTGSGMFWAKKSKRFKGKRHKLSSFPWMKRSLLLFVRFNTFHICQYHHLM